MEVGRSWAWGWRVGNGSSVLLVSRTLTAGFDWQIQVKICYILDWIKEVDCHAFYYCVSWARWFKVARKMIQMMIWVSVCMSPTQDVGTKVYGWFGVTLSFLSNGKANSKWKEICVKIPSMITTLWCDGKGQYTLPSPPPAPAFWGDEKKRESPLRRGGEGGGLHLNNCVASFWNKRHPVISSWSK